jgi:hypothetical protein
MLRQLGLELKDPGVLRDFAKSAHAIYREWGTSPWNDPTDRMDEVMRAASGT